MKIGILSDTHGDRAHASEAARLFVQQRVSDVIHCGDYGTQAVLADMATILWRKEIQLHVVAGNCDFSVGYEGLPSGVRLYGAFGSLERDGCRMAFMHGHDSSSLIRAYEPGRYDVVFSGHTHIARDQAEPPPRRINPGAFQRVDEITVAIFDTSSECSFYVLGS